MREEMLRRFFEGSTTARDFALDLGGALVRETSGSGITRHPIVDMSGEFEVKPAHLVKVCDAVLNGSMPADVLNAIGFCLIASDAFHWNSDSTEGDRVANVAFDWSAPEINYSFTTNNVTAWRRRLLGEEVRLETNRPGA
jgi:hypothetical protein